MTAAAAVETFGFTRRGPWPNSPDNNFTEDDSGYESFNFMRIIIIGNAERKQIEWNTIYFL